MARIKHRRDEKLEQRARRYDVGSERMRQAEYAAAASGTSVERALHNDFERLPQTIKDAHEQIAQPCIAVDTLACMERQRTINAGMRHAGNRFHEDFVAAGFVALRAADLLRESHVHGAAPPGPGGSIDAKDRLWGAMRMLGGLSAPAALALWHVVGRQESLKDWAARSGWAGRPIHQQQASGILVAALGAIQPYYEGA